MAYDTKLKNGALGGQTIYGGTGAGEDLTIQSTTDATKGDIILNPDGGKVGIGTASPNKKQEVLAATTYQQRLSYSGIVYTDIGTDSASALNIATNAGANSQIALYNNSLVTPGYSFQDASDYGIGYSNSNLLFYADGTLAAVITASIYKNYRIPSDWKFGWASSTGNTTAVDTSLTRAQAGTVQSTADNGNAQLRLTYTPGAIYTDIGTNSSSNLIIKPVGKIIGVNSENPVSITTGFGGTFQKSVLFLKTGVSTDIPSVLIGEDGGSAIQFVKSDNTPTGDFGFYANDMFFINRIATGKTFFYTNSIARMTIESGGNVGIGTTTPPSKLSVYDNTINGGRGIQLRSSDAGGTDFSYAAFQSLHLSGEPWAFFGNNSYIDSSLEIRANDVTDLSLGFVLDGRSGHRLLKLLYRAAGAADSTAGYTSVMATDYQGSLWLGNNLGANPAKISSQFIWDYASNAFKLAYNGSNVGTIYTSFSTNSNGILNIAPTGGSVVFPQGTVANPAVAFGDGDSGFYESSDDNIAVTLAGSIRWNYGASYYFSQIPGGAALGQLAASSTAPVHTFTNDTDTGIGKAGSDQLSLIAGGIEGARITTTTFDILKGIIKTDTVSAQDLTITTGTAKTLVLDTPVYEDLNFNPLSSGGPAATLPDYVTINNTIHREFTSANNQICGDSEETPHCYKLSSQIYPHIHIFLKGGESVGTTGVTFTLYWELRQSTGTTSGSVPLSATSAELGTTAGANKLTISDAIGFAGAAELGAQLSITLARTGGDAGDVIVTTYGVHYQIDTIGSRTILTK